MYIYIYTLLTGAALSSSQKPWLNHNQPIKDGPQNMGATDENQWGLPVANGKSPCLRSRVDCWSCCLYVHTRIQGLSAQKNMYTVISLSLLSLYFYIPCWWVQSGYVTNFLQDPSGCVFPTCPHRVSSGQSPVDPSGMQAQPTATTPSFPARSSKGALTSALRLCSW